MSLFTVNRMKLVMPIIGLLFLLVALVWRQSVVQERNSLRYLYLMASGGDLRSVQQLSQSRSSHAQWLLVTLAQDQGATGDSRVAAIEAMADRLALDTETLGRLIRINQPFAVRHAAAEVLSRRGCDDACVYAALYAMHPIWKGESALEASKSTEELYKSYGLHPDPLLLTRINADLRNKTEHDYRSLLNSNPCATQKALKQKHESEPAFIQFVLLNAPPC